jgi:glycosyltransferase involved in cell wall biosynthesis
MINFPLVSIGIVTYNSARYVRQAIESVLLQTYQHIEVVICDDCSTDDTWDVINSFADPRIRKFRNDTNIGEYPNRNKAIQMATGDFFIFIDGDDMIYPHGIELMSKMLNAFPECGMAVTERYRNNMFYPVVIEPHDLIVSHYLSRSLINSAFTNTFFRLAVLREVGGVPVQYPHGDDYVRLKIAMRYKTLIINDSLSWWRETPGQASAYHSRKVTSVIKRHQMDWEIIHDSLCPISEYERKDIKFNLYRNCWLIIMSFIRRGQLNKAKMLYKGCQPPLFNIASIFASKKQKDPFTDYTPSSPLKIEIQDHPLLQNNFPESSEQKS